MSNMFKVTVKKDLTNLKQLIPRVKSEFKSIAKKPLKEAIIGDIEKGVSPVKGERFQKYSTSYKDVIRGKKTFRKSKQGHTYVTNEKDADFAKHGKKISPVNLKLSGDMLRSFYINAVSGAGLLGIGFKHFLADIHNKQGASIKKVIRRILPRGNEKFNKHISDVIVNSLKEALRNVLKRY